MESTFSLELAKWIEEKDISRKEFIALMQTYDYNTFYGLDAITLSRWLNGKSTPSLFKQLLIAKYLKIDMTESIIKLTNGNNSIPEKHTKLLLELTRIVDNSINTLSYSLVSNCRTEIVTMSYQDYKNSFGEFYNNITALSAWRDLTKNLGDRLTYKAILIKNLNNITVGHWMFIEDVYPIAINSQILKLKQNEKFDDFVFVSLGYFNKSSHLFELIINAACYYLSQLSHRKRYLAIFVTHQLFEFTKNAFEAEQIAYYPPKSSSQHDPGIYLVKIDAIKAISKPITYIKVRERLLCLSSCNKDCNKCNLNEMFKP